MRKSLVKLTDAFLQNINKLMKQHNLTNAALARKLGVSRQQVDKYLDPIDPKFSTVSKFADAFGIEETDLVDPKFKIK